MKSRFHVTFLYRVVNLVMTWLKEAHKCLDSKIPRIYYLQVRNATINNRF